MNMKIQPRKSNEIKTSGTIEMDRGNRTLLVNMITMINCT